METVGSQESKDLHGAENGMLLLVTQQAVQLDRKEEERQFSHYL